MHSDGVVAKKIGVPHRKYLNNNGNENHHNHENNRGYSELCRFGSVHVIVHIIVKKPAKSESKANDENSL